MNPNSSKPPERMSMAELNRRIEWRESREAMEMFALQEAKHRERRRAKANGSRSPKSRKRLRRRARR